MIESVVVAVIAKIFQCAFPAYKFAMFAVAPYFSTLTLSCKVDLRFPYSSLIQFLQFISKWM